VKPTTRDACKLLHDGSLALSRVEANGIRIDVVRLDKTIEKVKKRIDKLSKRLHEAEEWKVWKRLYGSKTKQGARQQLGRVLKEMGHEWGEKTVKGRAKVDEIVLEGLDVPFVKSYLEIEKLMKLHGTYLKGVRREVVDGFLHPSFDLNTVITFRSSSSNPNFQNIPIRDKSIGKLIRSCFVPREDHVLVEIDFSGLEVRIAACYHKDPVMVEYIETGYDLHREMAAECFCVEEREVSKEMRFYAKNQFVFPEFYGSYFMQCAPNLWKMVVESGLQKEMADDNECRFCGRGCMQNVCSACGGKQHLSVKDHLAENGIEELGSHDSMWGEKRKTGRNNGRETGRIKTESGTFVDHIRRVEQELWDRFEVYAQWKLDWHAKYLKRGWFEMLTGFRESGVYSKNDAINHPVQGSAFHCLLWCLIELVKWTGRQKMQTKVVGQIHDSIIADVHRDELDDYVGKAKELMTRDIRRAWDWIVVPLDVDVETSETNWFEMQAI